MGQARRRGDREERIAQAIERDRARREAAVAAEMARWEALTPEQQEAERAERERARAAHRKAAQLMAMAAAMGGGRA